MNPRSKRRLPRHLASNRRPTSPTTSGAPPCALARRPSWRARLWALVPLVPVLAILALLVLAPRARGAMPALATPAAAATAQLASFGQASPATRGAPPASLAELPPPGPDERVLVFHRRTGTWHEGRAGDVAKGGELVHAGRLLRVSRALGALQWIRDVDVAKLGEADATYDPAVAHRPPEADDVVYVLGEAGYHARLAGVRPGERVAFQGRVYETREAPGGALEVRDTGTQRNRVTRTYTRRSATLVDLTLRYGDGRGEATLVGTPEHPFFVPARGGYVPMGELAPGTVLQTTDGSAATVAARSERSGDFEVHNLEVEHAHNYFVSPPGSVEPGVLVHNATYGSGRPTISTNLPDRVTKELPAGQGRTSGEVKQARNFFERNRDAAQEWWSKRTSEPWPKRATHAEHPRPLKDGGDPLYIEPGFEGPSRPHMTKGPDGLSDFQRWGKQGGRPKNGP
jgi:pretoxin HINT domain-containing protein